MAHNQAHIHTERAKQSKLDLKLPLGANLSISNKRSSLRKIPDLSARGEKSPFSRRDPSSTPKISEAPNISLKKKLKTHNAKANLNKDLLSELNLSKVTFKKNSINTESLVTYIQNLKQKREEIDFQSKIMQETAKEASIHNPKKANQESVLWQDLSHKLDDKNLDEDEILEMEQALKQSKREALVTSMLEKESPGEMQVRLPPEVDKPIDILVQNTTDRKSFMKICKQSDKFLESEEFKDNAEFHYFKRCMESGFLPLPTINKINDGALMLVGYKLNPGI